MISQALEAEILRLHHAERWPIGTIATQMRVHHGTVRRVLWQAGVALAVSSARLTLLDPYRAFIDQTLEKYPTLRASRLYTMVRERGYAGGPDHFRAMVARLRPRPAAQAYLRLRTLPGEQSQVDWAHFAKITIGRAPRPLMAFVMVLSYSRMTFLRFYLSAAMANFVRGHVEAFAFFKNCSRVILYDNLKSAVLERSGDAIRFHPRLLELAAHYHFQPRPVAPARGNVSLFFLSLPTVELAVARVAERVRQGGHNIASSVIRRRFTVGRRNFENRYRAAVDAWALYDNSGDEPALLEWGERS